MQIPDNLKSRPVQSFGGKSFIVPWFVAKMPDGRFDFRVIRPGGVRKALERKTCWLCGKPLTHKFFTFVIGPMCTVNRISSEPPSHAECALYAATICPFLSNPKMRRSPRGLPDGTQEMAGVGIARNPGVTALWTTKSFKKLRVEANEEAGANAGILFQLGDPERVLWYCEGRPAGRKEVEEAFDAGFPTLMEVAMKEGRAAVVELQVMQRRAMTLLPKATAMV